MEDYGVVMERWSVLMLSTVSLDWYQVPCPRYEIAVMVMGATVWVTRASNYFSDRGASMLHSARIIMHHYNIHIPAMAQDLIRLPTFQPSNLPTFLGCRASKKMRRDNSCDPLFYIIN